MGYGSGGANGGVLGAVGAKGADVAGAPGTRAGWTDVVGWGVGSALVRDRAAARYGAAGRDDSDPQRRADPGTLPDTPSDLHTLPELSRFRALDPAPDPFEIPDELESLQAAVVTLAAHIHAADYRMLTYIAEFDRLGGWKLAGHRNCAEWLHFHTGIDKGAARERVRAARALPRLPLVSEAMSRGELSFSKVRAVTRLVEDLAPGEGEADGVTDETGAATEEEEAHADDPAAPATSAAEAEVLSYARACTTAELERFVQSWRHVGRGDEAELERRRHRSRSLSVSTDGDGMYRVRGTLDPEVGALLMRAIDWASDQLFHSGDDWAPEGGPRGPRTEEVTPRQRRADAIGLLAELAMGGGRTVSAESGQEEDTDSSGDDCDCSDHPPGTHTARQRATASRLSGSRPERYTVMLHVDGTTLAGTDGSDSGTDSNSGVARAGWSAASATPPLTLYSHLQDGTRVSAETSRRLACDASVVRVTHATDGSILDLGRKTRTLSPALRRALEIRDGGCRFPGCGLRFIEGHHIVHWENGGETRLSNLVSLCRRHHRAVHEEGFRVQVFSDGRLRFLDRLGWPLPDCAPPSRLAPDPVERLMADHRRRGIDPDEDTPAARYRRRADIPWDLEARAWEAVDR